MRQCAGNCSTGNGTCDLLTETLISLSLVGPIDRLDAMLHSCPPDKRQTREIFASLEFSTHFWCRQ